MPMKFCANCQMPLYDEHYFFIALKVNDIIINSKGVYCLKCSELVKTKIKITRHLNKRVLDKDEDA